MFNCTTSKITPKSRRIFTYKTRNGIRWMIEHIICLVRTETRVDGLVGTADLLEYESIVCLAMDCK